jgi:hypothetical protein
MWNPRPINHPGLRAAYARSSLHQGRPLDKSNVRCRRAGHERSALNRTDPTTWRIQEVVPGIDSWVIVPYSSVSV